MDAEKLKIASVASQNKLEKLKTLLSKFVAVANNIHTCYDLNMEKNGPDENLGTRYLLTTDGNDTVYPKVASGMDCAKNRTNLSSMTVSDVDYGGNDQTKNWTNDHPSGNDGARNRTYEYLTTESDVNALHDATKCLPDDSNVNNGDSIYDLDSGSIVNTNVGGNVDDTLDNNRKLQHAQFDVEMDESGEFDPTKNNSVASIEIKRHQGCNNTNMTVPSSGLKAKKLCCAYCLKRFVKLARHLQTVHKNEPDVKRFRALPLRSIRRLHIIEIIKKRGQHEWNTDAKLNCGELQPSRRQSRKFKKTAIDYRSCANCLGTFAKTYLRTHWNKCTNNFMKNERVVHQLSRAVEGRIHPDASEDLREIFTMIREDEGIRMIRFDWIVIAFGNDMCLNYSPIYQHGYTCNKLRDAAKLLCAAKSISPQIQELESLFHVKHCNTAIEAIRKVTKFDSKTKQFGSPSTASTLITLINTIGDLLVIENMKADDPEKELIVERFLKVFKKESKTKINKLVAVQKAKSRRSRNENIPTTADVQKLTKYLDSERDKCYVELKQKFSYQKWLQLAELTLASILIFNRRRTGEIRNINVSDYIGREIIADQCETLLVNLTEETKQVIKSRMIIRGKLDRDVPVLLKHSYENCLNLLLSHRKEACIPDANYFLFAIPTATGKVKRIDACAVLRSISKVCGASNPASLRGTKLRKHFATFCSTQNLSDNDVTNVANFMGHDNQVHRDNYRLNPMERQVGQLFPLLESAQGNSSVSSSASSKEAYTKKSGKRVATLKRQQNKTKLVNKKNKVVVKRTTVKHKKNN